MKNGESVQFSICKIDYEEVKKQHTTTLNEESDTYAADMCTLIIEKVKRQIDKKEHAEIRVVDGETLKGLVYKTYHHPMWEEMAKSLLAEETVSDDYFLVNANVSYILLYVYKNNIYAMTGGYGNHLIKDYIEKNWGLHLLPKILKNDDGVIRQVKENSLFGNASSVSKANRMTTAFLNEREMSKIFRELGVEVDKEIGEKLGVKYKEGESSKKKTGVVLKDSLLIRRALTVKELEAIICKIEEIEENPDNFSLGYFIHAKRLGIKTAELTEALIECLLNGQLENFQLVGDDYLAYYTTADETVIYTENGPQDAYCTWSGPITIQDIFAVFAEDEKRLSKAFMQKFLKKWTLCTKDAEGNEKVHPVPILKAMQGIIEYGENKRPCYLFRGQWYCMDEQYTDILQEEFETICDREFEKAEQIKKTFNFIKTGMTENEYNDSFFNDKNCIVGHKSLISWYEIADLFFWDSEYVYFMCNKGHFDGSGSRDLTNQILASADYFQKQMGFSDKEQFLKILYKNINERYKQEGKSMPISETEFSDLLKSRKICYIAGYMTGFKKDAGSFYAKYLTVDMYKRMNDKGYRCITLGIG